MTLETIQRLLPCVQNNDPAFTPCNELRRILAEQVDLISERIETLSQSRTILVG
nr:MerR family DNA-binding protein [Bradyrhizobium sp. 199]